jgi:hypothetical protein
MHVTMIPAKTRYASVISRLSIILMVEFVRPITFPILMTTFLTPLIICRCSTRAVNDPDPFVIKSSTISVL